MNKTVCDLCDDDDALKPATGMYVLIVRKITKVDADGGQTYTETEYDVDGRCMSAIRKATNGRVK